MTEYNGYVACSLIVYTPNRLNKHLSNCCNADTMQDARLKQLSSDLRSDLNSSSLTQLKEMVSELVQQLRDSMTQQAHTHRQTQPSLALTLGPQPLPLLETAHPLPSSPEELPTGIVLQSGQGVAPPDPKSEKPGGSRQCEDEEALSFSMSRGQSVLTESEIELDLAESRASSVMVEEEVSATHMAESVAESVSDFQYSMDFESSIHKSPLSGLRSPVQSESAVSTPLIVTASCKCVFMHVRLVYVHELFGWSGGWSICRCDSWPAAGCIAITYK